MDASILNLMLHLVKLIILLKMKDEFRQFLTLTDAAVFI